MKKIVLLVVSHVVLVAVGVMLAGTGVLSTGSHRDGEQERSTPARTASASERGGEKTRTGLGPGARFQAAWDSLLDQQLTRPERLRKQRLLLTAWALTDLPAAIGAALSEPGDDLVSALAPAFAHDPAGSWETLQAGAYGLDAGVLRGEWCSVVGRIDPLFSVTMLRELSPYERSNHLSALSSGSLDQPELLEKLADHLLDYPEEVVSLDRIQSFIGRQPPREDLLARITAAAESDTRRSEFLRLRYSRTFSGPLALEHDNALARQMIVEGMEALPAGEQAGFLFDIVTRVRGVNDQLRDERLTLDLVDLMVGRGDWEQVQDERVTKQINMWGALLPDMAAEWAVTLPEREETTALFQRGVERYIAQDLEVAWEWIQEFPAGLWRDHALAEYARQALVLENEDAARLAREQIADQDIRAAAMQSPSD